MKKIYEKEISEEIDGLMKSFFKYDDQFSDFGLDIKNKVLKHIITWFINDYDDILISAKKNNQNMKDRQILVAVISSILIIPRTIIAAVRLDNDIIDFERFLSIRIGIENFLKYLLVTDPDKADTFTEILKELLELEIELLKKQ